MNTEPRRITFRRRIQNRQFRKLFFKNWKRVFLSIVLPLVLCAFLIQLVSERSLIKEVDAAVERSTRNTSVTIRVLLDEAVGILEAKVMDEYILEFFQTERPESVDLAYAELINDAVKQLKGENRSSLYYSVDAVAYNQKFLVSSRFAGTALERMADQSLIEAFDDYRESNPGQNKFALLRTATAYNGVETKVITVYRACRPNINNLGFVSISIEVPKLISYLIDSSNYNQGAYLIVDTDGRVMMDTSGQNSGQILKLPESGSTIEIHGTNYYAVWTDLNHFDWKCVQLVPVEALGYSSLMTGIVVALIVVIDVIVGLLLSYSATSKLFRPVESILAALEDPENYSQMASDNSEIGYMLMRILELFQKNITLENEMISRMQSLRRARAKALQEQMTPHFLNNVLQVINWMALEETGQDDSKTSRSICLLADIIRMSKEQTGNLTTVRKEIQYTQKFMELLSMRYGAGINCKYRIDPAVQQMPIPAISLQTMVENSVAHGFADTEGCGNILVTIQATRARGLHIRVEDDGCGLPLAVVEKIETQLKEDYLYESEHIGLINLFQRFQLIYGDGCRFALSTSPYGGACVEIFTPSVTQELLRQVEHIDEGEGLIL